MEQTKEEGTGTLGTRVARAPANADRTLVEDIEAVGHDAAEMVVHAAEAVADAARRATSAPVPVPESADGIPGGKGIVAEENLSGEHKAKLLAEQQKVAGFGIVPPEERPPRP
jgi:hypothetical protein